MSKTYHNIKGWLLSSLILTTVTLVNSGCDKLLDAAPPNDAIPVSEIFTNDNTALSAVSGIYANMILGADPFYLTNGGITVTGGLCSDEFYDFSQTFNDYAINQIAYSNYGPVYYHWANTYSSIYAINSAIIGLEGSSLVSAALKQQLLGEAYFLRAYCYFYLTNIYGKVPLILNNDYAANAEKGRDSVSVVYSQVISDLQKAESLLTATYPGAEQVRANKYVASALLARVYLYNKQWALAETKASEVLQGPYTLVPDVTKVFLKANTEAIWQLKSVATSFLNAWDARWFIPGSTPAYVINSGLLNAFETNDKRKAAWIGNITYQGQVYSYPYKYKINTNGGTAAEYNTVFRLSEQYLIRAEARAQQNELNGAIQDVDSIRNRAGLELIANTNAGITQNALLDAIAHERRVELFAEYGHRWFDLIRTGKADEVLGALKPTWKSTAKLWPVPQRERAVNTNLSQNDGYE